MPAPASAGDEPRWFKSSYSGSSGSDCVEAAFLSGGAGMAVRDSKAPDGPVLTFDAASFVSFVGDVKTGRLDRP